MDDTRRTFNAAFELAAIKQLQADRRKLRWRQSKLMRYREELVQMRNEGASYRALQLWLRVKKRKRISDTTIRRFLINLPEVSATQQPTSSSTASAGQG